MQIHLLLHVSFDLKVKCSENPLLVRSTIWVQFEILTFFEQFELFFNTDVLFYFSAPPTISCVLLFWDPPVNKV